MLTEGVVLPVKALQRKAAGGGEDSARRSCSGLRAVSDMLRGPQQALVNGSEVGTHKGGVCRAVCRVTGTSALTGQDTEKATPTVNAPESSTTIWHVVAGRVGNVRRQQSEWIDAVTRIGLAERPRCALKRNCWLQFLEDRASPTHAVNV